VYHPGLSMIVAMKVDRIRITEHLVFYAQFADSLVRSFQGSNRTESLDDIQETRRKPRTVENPAQTSVANNFCHSRFWGLQGNIDMNICCNWDNEELKHRELVANMR
jgi:hypothetical protein